MGTLHDVTLQGVLLHDPSITFELRNAGEVSATEASPRPGSAVGSDALSELLPSVSGAQSVGISLAVREAGHPAIDPAEGAAPQPPDRCDDLWRRRITQRTRSASARRRRGRHGRRTRP